MNTDELYMRSALKVGEKARIISPPNPWVGCVLVQNGLIIAEGHTQAPGQAHAEVMALRAAGETACGATAYVTLEPCAHYGKTPPCTNALIEAKVKRVVVALEDPDEKVSGRGVALLREAGIEVTVGVCARDAEISLRPYLHHRKTGKAYCLLKTAVSIDGRVAAKDGSSKWISSTEARLDAHFLRSTSQAVMVGSGTALADNPALTVRGVPVPLRQPLRILLDRKGVVPAKGNLFDASLGPTLVITGPACPISRKDEWQASGAKVFQLEAGMAFESILSYLGSQGIIQLMVEGGPTLHSALLREKVCQELVIYTGEVILGASGLPAFNDLAITTIEEALHLSLINTKKLGHSIRNNYFVTPME